MDKKIALYTFFDDNFFEYGFTMLYSFVTNNPWFKGDIFIFSDDGENSKLSEENFEKIKRLYNRTYIHKVDASLYSGVFSNFSNEARGFMKACLYKCEVFKKDDYEVKLYIDADACFNKSVEELFTDGSIETVCGFMCRDSVCQNFSSNEQTMKTDDDYVNMGFFVVNGKVLKETDFSDLINGCQSIKSGMYKNKHSFMGTYPDQDCFNEFIKNILIIPALVYNAPAHRLNFNDIDKVKIFHYYGIKPWNPGMNYVSFYIWYKYHFFATRKLAEITNAITKQNKE